MILGKLQLTLKIEDGKPVLGSPRLNFLEDNLNQAITLGQVPDGEYAWTIDLDTDKTDGVPRFTLMAYDLLVQASIVNWIDRAIAAGVPEEKIARARHRYDEIIKFQSAHPERVKVPD